MLFKQLKIDNIFEEREKINKKRNRIGILYKCVVGQQNSFTNNISHTTLLYMFSLNILPFLRNRNICKSLRLGGRI